MKTNKIFSVAMAAVAMMAMTMTSCSKDDTNDSLGIPTNTQSSTNNNKTTVPFGQAGKMAFVVPVTDQMMEAMDVQLVITDASGKTSTVDFKSSDLKTADQIGDLSKSEAVTNSLETYRLMKGVGSDATAKQMYFTHEMDVASTPATYTVSVEYTPKSVISRTAEFDAIGSTVGFNFKQNGESRKVKEAPESQAFIGVDPADIKNFTDVLANYSFTRKIEINGYGEAVAKGVKK